MKSKDEVFEISFFIMAGIMTIILCTAWQTTHDMPYTFAATVVCGLGVALFSDFYKTLPN